MATSISWDVALVVFISALTFENAVEAAIRPPSVDIGHPAGFVPDCPGVTKNATISPRMLQQLQVVVHKVVDGRVYRKSWPILSVAKALARDKHIDLKRKKTVIYAVGFLDSAILPHSQAMGTAYAKRGYNVLLTETFFFTNIYPKSVRISIEIGRRMGELLVQLSRLGVKPENLELAGISLGAQIMGYAAKHYYKVTGKKPGKIVGLDPAGPCFRSMSLDHRLNSEDADNVVILHTNIDGFGIAEPLGHVDFYANGGEYQPSDIISIPCLIVCSHFKAILYWWQAIENPKQFIGIKCGSVQEARYAGCYNNTDHTNYLGLDTDFSKTGIYYLPTRNDFPYHRGKAGLKAENEVYSSIAGAINEEDELVV